MKKVLSLFFVGILFLSCTACQPTPEEAVVTQRDATFVNEKLSAVPTPDEGSSDSYKATVDAYKATLPDHWSDYIETEYIQMPIEAEIIVENTDSFPVYRVKRGYFDMKVSESIANQMMPDVVGVRDGYLPLPEEYAAAIKSLNERGFAEYAQHVFEESREAPEGKYVETDHIAFTGEKDQFYVIRLEDGTWGQVYMKAYSVRTSRMDILRGLDSMIHLADLVEFDGSYVGEGSILLTPSISQEEARDTLDDFLLKNGMESYSVDCVNAGRHFSILYREEISQGWRFELIPAYGYYPLDAIKVAGSYGGWLRLNVVESYCATWNMENVYVYISENGVEYIQWNNPLEYVDCVNPCVELMDFSEIQKKFISLLTSGLSWFERPCSDEPTLTRVVLTVVPQQMYDEPDSAYLMPVWVAVIRWNTRGTDIYHEEVIGINAIDGSRVALG